MATTRTTNPDGFRFYTIDGKKYVSATTVCKMMPKPFLLPWYAKMEKQAVGKIMATITNSKKLRAALQDLVEGPAAAIAYIEKTAKFGNKIHSAIESRFSKEKSPTLKKKHKKVMRQFDKWWKGSGLVAMPKKSEFTVHSKKLGVAGTLDLLAKLKGKDTLMVLDWKTGSGVYPEAFFQVVMYIMCLNEMGFNTKAGIIVHAARDGSPIKLHQVIPGHGRAPSFDKVKRLIDFWKMLNVKKKGSK